MLLRVLAWMCGHPSGPTYLNHSGEAGLDPCTLVLVRLCPGRQQTYLGASSPPPDVTLDLEVTAVQLAVAQASNAGHLQTPMTACIALWGHGSLVGC